MIQTYKINKSFGPVGSSTGIFIFFIGLFSLHNSLFGILIVFFGAFIGFTYSCSIVDFENKKIKFANSFFGLFKIGKWIDLNPKMKIGLKKTKKKWRTYSRSNRSLDISDDGFLIILYDKNNKQILPICKLNSAEKAKKEFYKIKDKFGLNIVELH